MTEPGWPQLSFPAAEAEYIRKTYQDANVILEYGSGGSTVLAAQMPGKLVISVESDARWSRRLQQVLDAGLPSQGIVHHVDIGPTGAWGRPLGPDQWQRFHRYPMDIWSQPFFRHPDVVLIDGRFRPACFAAVAVMCTRPVTVLFDDYADRKAYHDVEKICAPDKMIGRMAIFSLKPGDLAREQFGGMVSLFSRASYHGGSSRVYDAITD
ncbi:MAG: hypothetical protein P3W90_005490 [Paracoccus sp. (in: a-proteobacteria)]|nr:hypothetical protein [Paracoccus sp. (in: a-proteobacteria)]